MVKSNLPRGHSQKILQTIHQHVINDLRNYGAVLLFKTLSYFFQILFTIYGIKIIDIEMTILIILIQNFVN